MGPRDAISRELADWRDHTVTIYGLESIGEAVAVRGRCFEMDVYGVRRDLDDYEGCLSADCILAAELRDALPETDVLVATVPLTGEMHRSLDAGVFGRCSTRRSSSASPEAKSATRGR